jgi:ribose 5-phosphate isomerase B
MNDSLFLITNLSSPTMKIALGSDEANELTAFLIEELGKRGHSIILRGPLDPADPDVDWPLTASHVAELVARGDAEEGIVCCWTGTGASIAANKVPGVRAALCHDAETARGARIWNHANVLALSLRATSRPIAKEILDAWFNTSPREGEAQSDWNRQQIARVQQIEERYTSRR